MQLDERRLTEIVERVVARLQQGPAPSKHSPQTGTGTARDEAPKGKGPDIPRPTRGVYQDVDAAVAAAQRGYEILERSPLALRKKIVQAMRDVTLKHVKELSVYAQAETGLGRAEDKIKKNTLVAEKTPGMEALPTVAFTGDNGLTLVERAPYGVIAAITPCTNPTETILCNGLGMVAGGNSVVFNTHPLAKRTSAWHISLLNEAIVGVGGPDNLLTCVAEPTIEGANQLMKHKGTRIVVVTGGGEVVRAAMTVGKKCIAGGPGNPPVVVDETAHPEVAARGIIEGASFDNNVICSDEKEVVAVAAICDRLKQELKRLGAVELSSAQMSKLEKVIFVDNGAHINKQWVGKNAGLILRAAGISAPEDLRLAFCEVEEGHPLVQHEQLMPITPIVRVKDIADAIATARRVEHGFGHTSVIYSTHIEHMHAMGRVMNTCLFVKNAPSHAGLANNGEGYTSWTIAHPTGEGLTTAYHFTRERRCTLKDLFRIV
jgi:acyl-CoA reductase-like NAD-dependent aldehyde dehydrogenase